MNDRQLGEPTVLNIPSHPVTNYQELMLAEQRKTNQLLELLIQALADSEGDVADLPLRDLAGRLIGRG